MKMVVETLSNGLTVILVPIPGAKSVCEIFGVRAGWKYEQPEIYGISHFIEHMMFRGTEKRSGAKKISREIEGRGGKINAGTTEEYTCYWVKLPARLINIAHDVISDMILNSKFAPEGIEIEKKPVLEELSMNLDSTEGYVQDVLWPRLLYENQPIGQTGLGDEETIAGLKRRQLLAYLEKLYVAPNSVLSITGKIENPDKTLRDLENYYGKLSSKEPSIIKPPVVEKQRRPRISFKYRSTIQTHVMLGVRGYNVFHPRRYALKILEVILGGNMSSRMFIEVREKRGLAYSVSSGSEFQTDTGWFATYAGLNSKRIVEALEVMMEQYQGVLAKKVTNEELKAAKDFIVGSQEMALEDSFNLADFLVEQFLMKSHVDTPEERIEKYKAVTTEEVQQVAKDIFQNKNLNLVIVGPHRKLKPKLYPILRF